MITTVDDKPLRNISYLTAMETGILCRDSGLPCPLWRKAGTGQAHVPTFSFMMVKQSFMTVDSTCSFVCRGRCPDLLNMQRLRRRTQAMARNHSGSPKGKDIKAEGNALGLEPQRTSNPWRGFI